MSKVKRVTTIAFGQGVNVLVNFLFLPYMARALSVADYGTYGQVLLISAFTTALLASGLSKILYVYLAKDAEQERSLDSNLVTAFTLGIVGATLLGIFAESISASLENDRISALLKIYAWSIPFRLAYQSLVSKLIFSERVKVVTAINIGANLLKVVLVVISIQFFASLTYAFWSMFLCVFIQMLLAFFIVKRSWRLSFKLSSGKRQLLEGLPLGLTGLLGTGILYIDGLMVSKILGLESYAIYRNGAIEVPFIATMYSSVAAIVLPEVSKLFSGKKFDEIFQLKRKVIMNTILIIYPILIFLLYYSSDLILIYLGERYAASAIIFSVFNLTLLIRVNDYSDILIAANRSRSIFKYYVIAFTVNLLLNVLFINLFGSVGAAIATVISIALVAFLQLRESMIILNKRVIDLFSWKKILHMALVCSAIGFVLSYLGSLLTDKAVFSITFGLLYFPLVFGYLLRRKFYSKQIIDQLIGKNRLLRKWV